MPVLPIHNSVAVPDSTIYLRPEYYRSMTGREPQQDAKVILIVAKEPIARNAIKPDSFYPIGVSGIVRETDLQGFVTIELNARVNVEEVEIQSEGGIHLKVSRRPDLDDLDPIDAQKRLTAVKEGKVYQMDRKLFHFKPNNRWDQSYEQLEQILYGE